MNLSFPKFIFLFIPKIRNYYAAHTPQKKVLQAFNNGSISHFYSFFHTLKLVKVVASRNQSMAVGKPSNLSHRPCFSVIWETPGKNIPSGAYRIEHPQLANMDLFVSPIENPADGLKLEAIWG